MERHVACYFIFSDQTCLESMSSLYLDLLLSNTRAQSSWLHWTWRKHQFKRTPLEADPLEWDPKLLFFRLQCNFVTPPRKSRTANSSPSGIKWISNMKFLVQASRILRTENDRNWFSDVVVFFFVPLDQAVY